jgi:hypothetical protein
MRAVTFVTPILLGLAAVPGAALLLAIAPGPIEARQAINLYADADHTSTEAFDLAPGTLTVFVVHEGGSAGVAIAFKIAASPGFTGVWLSETSPFVWVFGTSPSGVEIGYAACVQPPVLVLEVKYTVFGTSEECSLLEVVGHPNHFGIDIALCQGINVYADGGRLTVNPTEGCSPVPAEPSTWGKVKALYQ